jgi:8-hydroxy-5-deazaflavin:NADPH oxidoreductase
MRARRHGRRVRIAIVGGTGAFGRALAARWHRLDHDVTIGSRDRERAERQAAVIGVQGATNADAARDADFVVLAVESRAAVDTARDLADAIGDAVVLCVASDLRFTKGGVLPGRKEGSLAEDVATLVRGPVVSGLQAIPAAQLARPEPLDEDVLVCGDDADAKRLALDLARPLVRGRAIDAGPLANARALEGMTAVILHVNRTYKVVAGLRLTGFE